MLWRETKQMTAMASSHPRGAVLADLTRWLDGAGVTWRAERHAAAATAADEATSLVQPAEMVAKTLVLVADGRLLCVALPASARLSTEKARQVLGATELALAREDEILRTAPAYELGALPPCGPGVPALAVVDQSLLTYSHVHCAAGERTASLALDPEDLVRVTGAAVADLSV
jgi:Cys-tRNA(Pro)/Cys-tRNA(Cys) deacylase